uniref:Uncharacterized protein n=1 Tax=Arundo donax TaxID=35708 RepID=A0A0A9C619_ARUDO
MSDYSSDHVIFS